MDIKRLEKAVQEGDLERVSKLLAREIFELRIDVQDLEWQNRFLTRFMIITAGAGALILTVASCLA